MGLGTSAHHSTVLWLSLGSVGSRARCICLVYDTSLLSMLLMCGTQSLLVALKK